MQKQARMLVVGITCLILALCFTLNAQAQTPPVLQISDGTTTLTIDGAANVHCTGVGPCTTSTISAVPGSGLISWAGKLGVFTSPFSVSGRTKPTLSEPQIDIAVNGLKTAVGQNATLTVQWTDTDFSGTPPFHFHEGSNVSKISSAQAQGTSTVTWAAYVDSGNNGTNLFGLAQNVFSYTASPLSNGPSNQDVMGINTPVNEPFSMTNVVTINLGSNTSFSTDFYDLGSPAPPIAVQCFSQTTGVVGTPYTSALLATGGTGTGYTYSITSGSLPPDLTLNTSTGVISGNLTDADLGSYNVFFQVTDSGGNTASTSGTGCPLTVTTPPAPVLTCPPTSGVVGTPFGGSLQASGGLPPYSFSITSGSLPTGLNLDAIQQTNNLTGTEPIDGTPTAPGIFTFTAQVVDSRGDTNGTTTSQCLVNVTEQPQLAVVKTPKGGTFTMGAQVSYTIVVSNPAPAGSSDATNVTLVDTLPTNGGLTWASASATQGSCSINGGNLLTCTLGSIPAQGIVVVTVTSPNTTPNTACQSQPNPLALATADGGLTAQDSGSLTCTPPPPSADCVTIVAVQGFPITPVTLTGNGGVGGPYTFASNDLPAGLSISSTGTISGTPTVSGTFTYHVTVTDSAGNSGTISCSVTINPPPSANCVAITGAVQGVPIMPVTLTGSGGVGGPYTFTSNDLPAGLSISSTGTISGTPTVSGTFTYHVTVTDSAGNSSTISCSVTVNPPPSANCVTIVAVQGFPITPVTLTGNGGVGGPYTFTSNDLPAGLTISSTGTISGTPTVSGTFTYHVTVTDAAGNTGTISCSVTINAPPSANCVTIVAVQGVAITPVTLTASGGVGGPYTFTSNDLPAGLSISSTGTISGTPTVSGTFTYHVTVKDAAGNSSTISCSVTINPPPSANCVTIVAVQGVAITPVTLTGSGGVGGPYTFTSNDLPAGLSISLGGTISGTPTVSGTFTYHVTVKDSAGNSSTISCSVTINPPPSATCLVISNAQAGVPLQTGPLTGSGGVGGPYTFSSSDLPAGLTMAADGSISGTPTVSGTFTYHVTVKDAAGNVGTIACSVSIIPQAPPPLMVGCPTAATGTVGTAYNGQVPVSGGTPPYTFSVFSGSLPTGLTLNTSTGAITGTPTTAGSFAFTIKVVDSLGMVAYSQCTSNCTTINATWDLSGPNQTLGTSQAYTVNGITVTAYGFTNAGAPTNLYWKQAGGDENGLGLANTGSDHEIDTNNFIQLDLSDLIAKGATSAGMTIGSIQSGEGFNLYGSNTLGQIGVLLQSGTSTIDFTPFAIPQFGTYKYVSVRASAADVLLDAVSAVLSSGCTITITGKPSASCVSITAIQGLAITPVTLTATGGAGGPYTFTATGLPTGLSISSGGTISGTPTVSGTFNYTVTITDKAGNKGTLKCSVTVNVPPPLLVVCPTATGKVGTLYDSPGGASGGVPPYTYSIASGSLPPGLTLNTTTGEIKGTPTTAGVFSFTIQVVDSLGTVAYSSCSGSCTAITENFIFGVPTGKLGTSQTYTLNGITLTAYGFANTNTPTYLYGKNSGGDEVGLGIYGTADNEISTTTYVQVDVSQAFAAGATSGTMIVGSVQAGEKYNVYGSNTKGSIGTLLLSNQTADIAPFNLPSWGTYKYYAVRAAYANVVLGAITFSVPAKCTITITSNQQYETYTPGGWGAPPSGGNIAYKLKCNFSSVYGSAGVKIGGNYTLSFTSAYAIQVFLPSGGTPGVLNKSQTNPTSTSAGEFASQVLALELNVDFSNKGLIKPGLPNLKVLSGPLANLTVTQVLALSNAVLGGATNLLPSGMSISDLNNLLSNINGNYDKATTNNGYLY